jgi:hypothetical protein
MARRGRRLPSLDRHPAAKFERDLSFSGVCSKYETNLRFLWL